MEIKDLPTLNACLNGLAGCCLIAGWIAIRQEKKELHQKCMVAAFTISGLFLVSYLTYHFLAPGMTKYQGQGFWRTVYFTILISHTLLAMVVAPAAIMAVVKAFQKKFEAHTRITRWLTPIWVYVSITGVLVYLMLYVFSDSSKVLV